MDASGVDRPTALVCGRPAALLSVVALCVAERGYDVHLPAGLVPEAVTDGWLARRLHPADDAEGALVAAASSSGRPVELAVVGEDEPGMARVVTVLQHACGGGVLLGVGRPMVPPQPAEVSRALDALLDGGATRRQRRRAARLLPPVADASRTWTRLNEAAPTAG